MDGNSSAIGNFFHATALMFVAHTGYARIATMSEEVRDPKVTIPRTMRRQKGQVILFLETKKEFFII